jgi:hypothetical protein
MLEQTTMHVICVCLLRKSMSLVLYSVIVCITIACHNMEKATMIRNLEWKVKGNKLW